MSPSRKPSRGPSTALLGLMALGGALFAGCGDVPASDPAAIAPPPAALSAPPAVMAPPTASGPSVPAPSAALDLGPRLLPKAKAERSMGPGVLVKLPSAWTEATVPGKGPTGARITEWRSRGDAAKEGPGSVVAFHWKSTEPVDPPSTIKGSAEGDKNDPKAPKFEVLEEPRCEMNGEAVICSSWLKNLTQKATLLRIMVFQDQEITQMDLLAPPDLGDQMRSDFRDVLRSVRVVAPPAATDGGGAGAPATP